MYLSGSAGSLCSLLYRPRADLLGSRGEEGYKPQKLVTLAYKAVKSRLGNAELLKKRRFFLRLKLGYLSLDARADGRTAGVLGIGIFLQCGVVGIVLRLAARIILAHIGNIDDRLLRKERRILKHCDLVRTHFHGARRLALAEMCAETLEKVKLRRQRLVVARVFAQSFQLALDYFKIRKYKLVIYRLNIADGIDATVNMDYILVLKATHHMKYRVAFAYVRKKLVAESLALCRAAHQTGDIKELDSCGRVLFGRIHFCQRVEPRVRHRHHADVWLYCTEGIVCRVGACARKRIKNCAFADVGQAYDSEFHIFYASVNFLRRGAQEKSSAFYFR